jgi:hypothetical protein
MTIAWQWLPLIFTIIFAVLNSVLEDGESMTITGILEGLIGTASLIFYIGLGCAWLYHHINIV